MENFIDFYNKRGLIELYPLYYKSFNILLDAKGLSPNITLKEYYDYCGIEQPRGGNARASEFSYRRGNTEAFKLYRLS